MKIFSNDVAQEMWKANKIPPGKVLLSWGKDHYIYYLDSLPHREDGPAAVFPYGSNHPNLTIEFWLYGRKCHSKEEWFEALNEDQKLNAIFKMNEWR